MPSWEGRTDENGIPSPPPPPEEIRQMQYEMLLLLEELGERFLRLAMSRALEATCSS